MTYTDKYGTQHLGKRRGRPPKQYIKKEVSKDIKKYIKRGRPTSKTESLKVISGHLRVKTSKSRTIKIGGKEFSV